MRFERQQIVVELHPQALQLRLRRVLLEACVQRFLLNLRIAQLENDAVRQDGRAWLQQYALDPCVGRRRNPACVLRHERARPADLPDDRAALDRVAKQRVRRHRRRRRFHPCERDRDGNDQDHGDHAGANAQQAAPFQKCRVPGDIWHATTAGTRSNAVP